MAQLLASTTIGGRNILNEIDNLSSKFLDKSDLENQTIESHEVRFRNNVRIGIGASSNKTLYFGDSDYVYIREVVDDRMLLKCNGYINHQTNDLQWNGISVSMVQRSTSVPSSLENNYMVAVYS